MISEHGVKLESELRALLGQMEPRRSLVAGVGAAFEQPHRLQPLGMPAGAGSVDSDLISQTRR